MTEFFCYLIHLSEFYTEMGLVKMLYSIFIGIKIGQYQKKYGFTKEINRVNTNNKNI